jgi:tetratricopeptide (TPR) repeat protein
MGRLEEAREASQQVRHAHPYDRVAVNGLALILVEMGQLDEALNLIKPGQFVSEQDWIDEHVHGMILVYQDKLGEAAAVFERSIEECPFHRTKAYLRTSLAATKLRLDQLDEAVELVDQLDSPEVAEPVCSLRIQICGMQDDFERAKQNFQRLPPPHTPVARELFGELELRFVNREPGRHDNAWLVRQQLQFQLEHLRQAA